MTDLQCPARIFWLRHGATATEQAAALLQQERLVAVYGPEQGYDLSELADLHRGEAVLLVGEHPYEAPLVLVEVDASGRTVTPWVTPDDQVRHP